MYVCTKILVFRGFYSSRILILRAGMFMSIRNFPESLSQAILVGRFLVGRLGVKAQRAPSARAPLRLTDPVRLFRGSREEPDGGFPKGGVSIRPLLRSFKEQQMQLDKETP